MTSTTSLNKGLSANVLKYVAIVAMLIDHIAWAFIPFNSPLAQIMHIIGRLTAPIMCFFIAEGYYHTRSLPKYMVRLGIFAVISHFAYQVFESGNPLAFSSQTSVIYTLFLGLLALTVWHQVKNGFAKISLVVFICFAALPGDWLFIGVLYVLVFGIYHEDFKKQMIGFSIVSTSLLALMILDPILAGRSWYNQLFVLGVFAVIPLLAKYNGQRGKGGKFSKWVFYIFYPLHLFILGILKFYIFI